MTAPKSRTPWRSAAYVYAAYMATAPVAKLRTPELRYVITRASARAANTPPLPSPSRSDAARSMPDPHPRGLQALEDLRRVLDVVARGLPVGVERCPEPLVGAHRRLAGHGRAAAPELHAASARQVLFGHGLDRGGGGLWGDVARDTVQGRRERRQHRVGAHGVD